MSQRMRKKKKKRKKRKRPEEKGEEKPRGRRKHAHRPWKALRSSGKGDDEEGIRSMERKSMLSAGRKKNHLSPSLPQASLSLHTARRWSYLKNSLCSREQEETHLVHQDTQTFQGRECKPQRKAPSWDFTHNLSKLSKRNSLVTYPLFCGASSETIFRFFVTWCYPYIFLCL